MITIFSHYKVSAG